MNECGLQAIMKKNEEYARGWVKLFPMQDGIEEFAQYALDLQKLRLAHEGRCAVCSVTAAR